MYELSGGCLQFCVSVGKYVGELGKENYYTFFIKLAPLFLFY